MVCVRSGIDQSIIDKFLNNVAQQSENTNDFPNNLVQLHF